MFIEIYRLETTAFETKINKKIMSDEEKYLFMASGELMSLSSAAEMTPYTQEYLSLLARKGTIKAIKISRDWLTTPEVVLSYMEKQEHKHKKLCGH
ncbi:MAG: hypothetical protein NVSMB66_4480 [Candidatus Doudnabacteria bacterium]